VYVDRGYAGEEPAGEAEAGEAEARGASPAGGAQAPWGQEGLRALVPRRWVVERSFAWASRFRRPAKDYERLPETVAGLHFVAFACLMLHRAIGLLAWGP
jgi:hypothetical protein